MLSSFPCEWGLAIVQKLVKYFFFYKKLIFFLSNHTFIHWLSHSSNICSLSTMFLPETLFRTHSEESLLNKFVVVGSFKVKTPCMGFPVLRHLQSCIDLAKIIKPMYRQNYSLNLYLIPFYIFFFENWGYMHSCKK